MRVILVLSLLCLPLFARGAEAADCSVETAQEKKFFTSTSVNLRTYPSTYGTPMVTLPAGQTVFAFREQDGWSQVNVKAMNIVGWIKSDYLKADCVDGVELTRETLPRASVVAIVQAQSLSSYSGSCPCPYNTDRAGRRCGGRSAYSRPGGASPKCYPGDVSDGDISRFRNSR